MTDAVESRVKGFLGLCMRAGQIVSGQEACVDAVRRETAGIVLMDEGASDNTRKRVKDACGTHGVPLYGLDADALGRCIGKAGRMVAALPRGGMADKLLSLLENEPRL